MNTTSLEQSCTILTVDLAHIATNWKRLAERVAPAECTAVVKANAYGLGVAPVARALFAAGSRTFFVANLAEAIALREILPTATIGVFNGLLPHCEKEYQHFQLLPVLNHLAEVERWHCYAKKCGRKLPAFLHIDTGMNRLGLDPFEVAQLRSSPHKLEGIAIAAYLSHFACADIPQHPLTAEQAQRFSLARQGLPAAAASLCNSSGIFCSKKYHLNLVRPGCALYGLNPIPTTTNPMKPVVRWQGRILQLRDVPLGETIGYGASYCAHRPLRLATVAAGYADGLLRPLHSRIQVAIGTYYAPIIGRISMDMITVDVTDIPCEAIHLGDFVDLLNDSLTIDELAIASGTIGYEIITALGRRCTRRYME